MVGFTAIYEHIAEGCNMLARPRGWSVFAVACVPYAKVLLGHKLVLLPDPSMQLQYVRIALSADTCTFSVCAILDTMTM